MHVLVLHPRLSVMGGGERVAIHSIQSLLNQGHNVSLLSEDFDVREFEDFYGCKGLFEKIGRLTYPPFRPIAQRAMLYGRMVYHEFYQKRLLAKNRDRFDLAISTQDVLYAPSAEIPTIQYCYYPEFFPHLLSNPNSKSWRLYYLPATVFYRKKVSSIKVLLSVSEYSRGFIRKVWGRDASTVYPPCPVEDYSVDSGAGREDIVLTTGRIVPEKRHDQFLEIARFLPQARFIIVGSVAEDKRAYYESLVRMMPKNAQIVLSPLRKNKELLSRAKVYVHCMENEHFGIAIVEAMAAGLIPVVHDSGGPREIVDEKTGFRWKTTSDAVDQVRAVLTNDLSRDRLSRAAKTKAGLYSDSAYETRFGEIIRDFEIH